MNVEQGVGSKPPVLGIGIDPGLVNLGVAVVEKESEFKFKVLGTDSFDTKGKPLEFTQTLSGYLLRCIPYATGEVSPSSTLTIERYATYKGISSSHAEMITVFVGVLYYFLHKYPLSNESFAGGNSVALVRAIDWKINLAKVLAKYTGFQNPSTELDKKFSMAAARHLVSNPEVIKNDHQADAICLECHRMLG